MIMWCLLNKLNIGYAVFYYDKIRASFLISTLPQKIFFLFINNLVHDREP